MDAISAVIDTYIENKELNNESKTSKPQISSNRSSFLAHGVANDTHLRGFPSGFDTAREPLKIHLAHINHHRDPDVVTH